MNKTLMYLQADMHRAINDGRKSFEVSVLDMKELLSVVLKSEYQELAKQVHIFAWIDPEKLKNLREGRRYYGTIRRGKNSAFSVPVFCIVDGVKPIDAVAQIDQSTPLQSDD